MNLREDKEMFFKNPKRKPISVYMIFHLKVLFLILH